MSAPRRIRFLKMFPQQKSAFILLKRPKIRGKKGSFRKSPHFVFFYISACVKLLDRAPGLPFGKGWHCSDDHCRDICCLWLWKQTETPVLTWIRRGPRRCLHCWPDPGVVCRMETSKLDQSRIPPRRRCGCYLLSWGKIHYPSSFSEERLLKINWSK